MTETSSAPYERVNSTELSAAPQDASESVLSTQTPADAPAAADTRVRWWCVLPISLTLCLAMTVLTVLAANMRGGTILASTLIPVTAYGALLILTAAINPLLRVVSAGRAWLTRREVMCVFAAMLVTAGIPGYGMAHQLVPLIPAPYNADWNTPQRGWQDSLHPTLNTSLFVQDEQANRAFYQGQKFDGDGDVIAQPRPNASWRTRVSFWWQVTRSIRWDVWIPPVAGWLVFIAASYGLFYSLVYVVLPAWDRREKLIFPLAQIPESLLPESKNRGALPSLFFQHGFWLAFGSVFLLLSFNAAVNSELVPGVSTIPLGMARWGVGSMLSDTALSGVTGQGGQMPGLMFLIIFTAVGIAFLLPTETSFSIWSYYLLGLGVIVMATWLGHGSTLNDFPSDWLWQNNPVTALGAGGFLAFAGYVLVRAIIAYLDQRRGDATWWTLRLGAPAMWGLLSIIALWAWLVWVSLPVLWAGLFVTVIVLIVTGLMRIVAESGVFWTQLHSSFFHIYRTFGLGRIFSAAALVPMLPVYWILYLDVKAFAGSNMLNASKMNEDTAADAPADRRHGRGVFHLNLILCIALVVLASIALLVILAHIKGGYSMNRWFFTLGPPNMLDRALGIVQKTPTFDFGAATWYLIGAGFLVLTLRVRRSWFWWPHPIGFIMLCNPLIAHLWFSFFLGWVCKRFVVQYGGKRTFDQARGIFIGLIVGELLAIFIWIVLSMCTDVTPGLTLNRYGA